MTYGCVNAGEDTLVIIDDSIVRGTTLRQSILRILDRLGPKRIIVVSSSPQVRFPDYYGIDLPKLEELAAFRACIDLLRESGRQSLIDGVYADCKANLDLPADRQVNAAKELYAPFTDDEIARRMADMLTPPEINAKVDILFQSLENLRLPMSSHFFRVLGNHLWTMDNVHYKFIHFFPPYPGFISL